MLGSRLPEALMEEAVNQTLQKLKTIQIEVNELLRVGRYTVATMKSEEMYRIATSLPAHGNLDQSDNLAALARTNREMLGQVASALQKFQTVGRKRQKAISGYRRNVL